MTDIRYTGELIVTYTLGGREQGRIQTPKTYKTKSGAIQAAKKLGCKYEYKFSTWSTFDFRAIPTA